MGRLDDAVTLLDVLGKIAGRKVLCVGDIMLDKYVYGDITRISPEAPIPVLAYQSEKEMLGGVGNVARNLAALKAVPIVIAAVGQDETAKKIQNLCAELSGATSDFVVDASRATSLKTRYIAGNQQMLRVDTESTKPLPEILEQQAIEKARAHMHDAEAVIVSDYAKGFLSKRLVAEIVKMARAQGKPLMVDPKGRNYDSYKGATVLSPNLKELREATGSACGSEEEIIEAAQKLRVELDVDTVLVTRGKDGMTAVSKGAFTLKAMAREIYDVSGAGDTVIATLSAAIASKATLEQAARLANVAAGIVVAKLGTAVALPSEIDEALLAEEGRGQDKLYALESLLDRIAIWRSKGLKVGFTNGCFDLVHPGHIALLRQARAACDKLVLGLNSDSSVKRLKGDSRPIQNQESRATVLSSLDSVDAVVIFSEDTPMRLIEAIKPEVLVKGADYTVEKVVGHELVQSYGGKIVLVPLEVGHSTSNTVKKIAAN